MPDPLRAHGARVYLVLAVLAGVLSAAHQGRLAAIAAGIGFAGLFVTATAWTATHPVARSACGVALSFGGPLAAAWLGAPMTWLVFAAAAAVPAAVSGYFAHLRGPTAPLSLAFGIAAILSAAPAAACAGGASPLTALILLFLLLPVHAWRALSVRSHLRRTRGLQRRDLRRLGWREAGLSLAWTLLVVAVLHTV